MHHLAVFGDVHGRIALMVTVARLWERETGLRLAGILQVGDLGAFPDHGRLDDATARMARDDPDELGFASFCVPTEEGERYLGARGVPKVVFIRGNHEDFDYLGQFREPESVDPWRRLWFVPDGEVFSIEAGEASIAIAGFGGIAPRDDSPGQGKQARHGRKVSRGDDDPRCFTRSDLDRAFPGVSGVDVLMTHAGPEHEALRGGSPGLAQLAKRLAPRVHLFGHHHQAVGPTRGPRGELLVGLDHLEFTRHGALQERCVGILALGENEAGFEFLSADTHPWLTRVRRESYRHLWTDGPPSPSHPRML